MRSPWWTTIAGVYKHLCWATISINHQKKDTHSRKTTKSLKSHTHRFTINEWENLLNNINKFCSTCCRALPGWLDQSPPPCESSRIWHTWRGGGIYSNHKFSAKSPNLFIPCWVWFLLFVFVFVCLLIYWHRWWWQIRPALVNLSTGAMQ